MYTVTLFGLGAIAQDRGGSDSTNPTPGSGRASPSGGGGTSPTVTQSSAGGGGSTAAFQPLPRLPTFPIKFRPVGPTVPWANTGVLVPPNIAPQPPTPAPPAPAPSGTPSPEAGTTATILDPGSDAAGGAATSSGIAPTPVAPSSPGVVGWIKAHKLLTAVALLGGYAYWKNRK